MAKTGKIFGASTSVYQDEARLLFDFYAQAAEQIVSQEERIEAEIAALEEDINVVNEQKSTTWKWFLTIILFFMYFIRNKQYDEQIAEISEKIDEKKKEHAAIFRDYKVTKMGVAYVPVASQISYEDKCFVVDLSGNVPEQSVELQLPRQSELLGETMAKMETLTKDAPIVETSKESEPVDTNDYSLSIQEINQNDYIGKLDRSIRTISYCMSDTDTKSVRLPLVTNGSDFLGFLDEYTTTDVAGHPIIQVFDDQKYSKPIDDFCQLNKLKDTLSSDTEQFEDVLRHLMHTMAMSVQTISAMKLSSTDKIVNASNDLLFKILKAPYNHYSPLLEADEISRIRNEKFDYADSIQGYEPFALKQSSRVKYNLFADEWTAEDNTNAPVPFGVHQIYEEIVAPMVQRLMQENRVERIKVYGHIHDQKLSYLNKWHQDVDAFYRSNHQESADIINNMQQSLSEYVEAFNTLAQLQKTMDSMEAQGATLDNTVVRKEENTNETLAAFELQAMEFKKAQEDFADYMDRLQEDIALKAERFGHVEFYDARLQDGYSNSAAVAAGEVGQMDERRKPLAQSNPLLAKEATLLPEPRVENVTYEYLSLNLPSIAVNALDTVSRIAVENQAKAQDQPTGELLHHLLAAVENHAKAQEQPTGDETPTDGGANANQAKAEDQPNLDEQ